MTSPLLEGYALLWSVLLPFLFRSGIAVICGGIIGVERERKGKPAGFRTNILICLGAALFMQIGELLQARLSTTADVSRIAAQVASGVGFLGAGTILHSRTSITGLTSAATIWVVASIGMLAGAGYPTLALISTALVVLTLWVLGEIEPRLIGTCEPATCELVFAPGNAQGLLATLALLMEQDIDAAALRLERLPDGRTRVHVPYCKRHAAHRRFLPDLMRAPGLMDVQLEGAALPPTEGHDRLYPVAS